MRQSTSLAMDLALAASLDALPPGCEALFPADPLGNAAWYRTVAADALPPDAAPCFAVLSQQGRPVALAPLQRRGRQLDSLTTPYTCEHWPVLTADAPSALAAGRRLGTLYRRWATVRLDAVPAEWPGLAPFTAGLRQAGLRVQGFDHFGNWHEPVAGRSWAAYLSGRPGALRETVRRKLKRCEQEARFELFAAPHGLQRGIDAFEAVYGASWKEPEPFPRFNAALMRSLAGQGALRLGVLWAGERPAAVQFWAVAGGRATVLKLAHDEAFKPLSPGTALTAMMIRLLLNEERVTELDFGRGDDPYKASWTTQRRRRIGLLAINPWRPAGLAAVGRGLAGSLRRQWGRQ